MIVAIQGYDYKQNKSVFTAAALAGMIAMQSRQKTLILQFIKNSDRGAETMLNGSEHTGDINSLSLSDAGMDSLLAFADGRQMEPADFTTMCDAILKAENRLDVAAKTGSNSFIEQLPNMKTEIKNLIDSASDIYDNIIIVTPGISDDNKESVEYLNSFADTSIYCRRQGNFRVRPVYGSKVIFLYPDWESDSGFSLKEARKKIITKKNESVLKIEHCRGAIDASMNGDLIYFIRRNRDAGVGDVNNRWVTEMKEAIDIIFNGKIPDEDPDWPELSYIAGKEKEKAEKGEFPKESPHYTGQEGYDASVTEAGTAGTPSNITVKSEAKQQAEPEKKSGGLFSKLFGKKETVQTDVPENTSDTETVQTETVPEQTEIPAESDDKESDTSSGLFAFDDSSAVEVTPAEEDRTGTDQEGGSFFRNLEIEDADATEVTPDSTEDVSEEPEVSETEVQDKEPAETVAEESVPEADDTPEENGAAEDALSEDKTPVIPIEAEPVDDAPVQATEPAAEPEDTPAESTEQISVETIDKSIALAEKTADSLNKTIAALNSMPTQNPPQPAAPAQVQAVPQQAPAPQQTPVQQAARPRMMKSAAARTIRKRNNA